MFSERPPCGIFACIDCAIRTCTASNYSHTGIVIVDPPWTAPGTYVWDSSLHKIPGPEDRKPHFGIQLVPIREYLDNFKGKQTIYKRSPIDEETYACFHNEFLTQMHDKVYGKHYDLNPVHWIAGLFHIFVPRSTKSFFCSAFVSFFLCQAGVLDANTDWTIVSPANLSTTSKRLHWKHEYGPDTPITDDDI